MVFKRAKEKEKKKNKERDIEGGHWNCAHCCKLGEQRQKQEKEAKFDLL